MSMLPNPTCTLTSSRTSEAAEICTDPYPTRIRPSTGCSTSSSWRWMSPPATSTSAGGGRVVLAGCHIRRRLAAAAEAHVEILDGGAGHAHAGEQRGRHHEPAGPPGEGADEQAETADERGQAERDLDPLRRALGDQRADGGDEEREPERAPAEGRGRGGRARRGRRRPAGRPWQRPRWVRTAPSSAARGDHSATATPSRRRATPMGPSGTVQSPVGDGDEQPHGHDGQAHDAADQPRRRSGRSGRQQQVAGEVAGDADAVEEGEDDEAHPGPHRRHPQRRRQAAGHPGQHPVPAAPDPVPRRGRPRRRRECALRVGHVHDVDSTEGSGLVAIGGIPRSNPDAAARDLRDGTDVQGPCRRGTIDRCKSTCGYQRVSSTCASARSEHRPVGRRRGRRPGPAPPGGHLRRAGRLRAPGRGRRGRRAALRSRLAALRAACGPAHDRRAARALAGGGLRHRSGAASLLRRLGLWPGDALMIPAVVVAAGSALVWHDAAPVRRCPRRRPIRSNGS